MSLIRKIRYSLMALRSYPQVVPSAEPIDVVIPVVPKDLDILPLCLQGLRAQVKHHIAAIYIVAPDDEAVRSFCADNGVSFVDEVSVMGFPASHLNLVATLPNGSVRNRSGWLFQQLIKLSGMVGSSRYYLCIDADHVLIQPHVFLSSDAQQVFYMSREHNRPYYDNIHRLFPDMPLDDLSFVDHKMLFDRDVLAHLRSDIEQRSGKDWVSAILDSIDRNVLSGFSEFELYGNYVTSKIQRPWREKELAYADISDYQSLVKRYAPGAWAVTFPEWKKKNKK